MVTNATTGVLTPATISGIQCPGTNCTVRTYYDQTGGGNSCTQATIASRVTLLPSLFGSTPAGINAAQATYNCTGVIQATPYSMWAYTYQPSGTVGSGIYDGAIQQNGAAFFGMYSTQSSSTLNGACNPFAAITVALPGTFAWAFVCPSAGNGTVWANALSTTGALGTTALTATGYTLNNMRNFPGIYGESGLVGGDITSTVATLISNAQAFYGSGVPPISSITATGPSSGTVNVASTNFTVNAVGGSFNGSQSVTIADGSQAGTFTPGSAGAGTTTITPGAGATSFTFTYTPASTGAKTLTITNPQSWPESPTSLPYTSSAAGAAPTVSSISDQGAVFGAGGPTGGNRPVTITGTNFISGATVTIGGTPCVSPVVNSSTSISCFTGAHATGTVSASVTTSAGTGSGGSYAYSILGLTTPATGSACATWGFCTLSFDEEWNDTLSVHVNATDNNGSNYVTPAVGRNWYTQSFGWANTRFCGSFEQWLNGGTTSPNPNYCLNPPAFQFNATQYYSVTSGVVNMTGHVAPEQDNYSTFNTTAFVNNANGYVGTPIAGTNGWYIEIRCASPLGTPADVGNFFYFVDNEMLRGVNTTTFTEIDEVEMHPSGVMDMNILLWNSNFASQGFGHAALQNGPTSVTGFSINTAFHVYGALFVPSSRPGGGFLHYFIDGNPAGSVGSNIPNGPIGATLAAQNLMMQINTNSNTHDSPFQIDYVRVWQLTPNG